ncbi:MAG: Xaa-Pro peptidase family protein [Pseudomonadota bacterium]|nr:Xaa-Pro peptidase family protein [Pseudomonadota bacterium]
MVLGVGGSTFSAELGRMASMTGAAVPISTAELMQRIAKAQRLMREQGIDALYLDTSTNLRYFTGIPLGLTERLHGAVIPAEGALAYLSPVFEEPKTRAFLRFGDDIRCWEEHEDPTALVIETVRSKGCNSGTIALDPATPFFTADGLRRAGNSFSFVNAASVTAACRQVKSPAEIALMQVAMDITLAVQKAAARCLYPGMSTTEVQGFLDAAHRKLGGQPASRAVQFGEATAYPHGVPYPQTLAEGDMVLVDTGCFVEGYRSDITRTYVFGEPTPRQREIWDLEQRAQRAGFEAAVLGAPCEAVDAAARGVIEAAGFGPGYQVPGLPHRTGHGIGLDVHEESYMVRGNKTPLAPGMCFSDEPMMCIYGEFGVRLEDAIYMSEEGARWFTQPCPSVDDPFGTEGVPRPGGLST